MTQAARIHNAIDALVRAGDFYPRTYDPDTRQTAAAAVAVQPSGVVVDEVGSQFGTPRLNRMEFRHERRSWRWRAVARFDVEVDASAFESAVLASPTILPRDEAEGFERVVIELVSADYVHPLQQSPTSGSQVSLMFEASLSPV